MESYFIHRDRSYGSQEHLLHSAAYPAHSFASTLYPGYSSYNPQYTGRERVLVTQRLNRIDGTQNPIEFPRDAWIPLEQRASPAFPVVDLYQNAGLPRSRLDLRRGPGRTQHEAVQYASRPQRGRGSAFGSNVRVTEPHRKRAKPVEPQTQKKRAKTSQAGKNDKNTVPAQAPTYEQEMAREVRMLHMLWDTGANEDKKGGKGKGKAQAKVTDQAKGKDEAKGKPQAKGNDQAAVENIKVENKEGSSKRKRSQKKKKRNKKVKAQGGTLNKQLPKESAQSSETLKGDSIPAPAAGDGDAWSLDKSQPDTEHPSNSDKWDSGTVGASQNGKVTKDKKSTPKDESLLPHHLELQRAASKAFKEFLGSGSDADDDSEDGMNGAGSDDGLEVADASQSPKGREEVAYDFFAKLFEDNQELQKMYVEHSNCGTFECLVCVGVGCNLGKKFGDLVSLVMHSSKILKTKKRPEHRGYGRAICTLLGWNPSRNPVLQKTSGIIPRGCIPPSDNVQRLNEVASQEAQDGEKEDDEINAQNDASINVSSQADVSAENSGLEGIAVDLQGSAPEENAGGADEAMNENEDKEDGSESDSQKGEDAEGLDAEDSGEEVEAVDQETICT